MKCIKNVFPACEGNEKWCSVNGSESTKMLDKWKQDETGSLGTRLQSTTLNRSTSFQRHIVLLEIVALADSKKNRIIKANDINLISTATSTDYCFKTMYVCFCAYDQSYMAFNALFVVRPPYPVGNYCLWTPLPLGISNDLPLGGGGGWMDIFWNQTIEQLGSYT